VRCGRQPTSSTRQRRPAETRPAGGPGSSPLLVGTCTRASGSAMRAGPGRNGLALRATRVRVNAKGVCGLHRPGRPSPLHRFRLPRHRLNRRFVSARRPGKPPEFPGTRPARQVIICSREPHLRRPGTKQVVTDGNWGPVMASAHPRRYVTAGLPAAKPPGWSIVVSM